MESLDSLESFRLFSLESLRAVWKMIIKDSWGPYLTYVALLLLFNGAPHSVIPPMLLATSYDTEADSHVQSLYGNCGTW